tara:strand:- start:520 stop:798 length:279 start_codon:yes stop_codon:yes gene_type:complete
MEGVKHYTKDGKEWKGGTHKMKSGLHTGSEHSSSSELLVHKKDLNSVLKMKTSPALLKLSSSCKAAARKKFDVYPSAYANMWASKTQKKGKC